jgi:predicted DNA-binding protein
MNTSQEVARKGGPEAMKRGGNVTSYLNAEEMERLEAQEKKEGRPKNQIIKQALREYLERKEG